MEKKSYYVSKGKKKKEVVYFEFDKSNGYEIKPKIKEKGAIEVSKIIIVNKDFSEKIIRKKIDKKINKLLKDLHQIDEEGGTSTGTIKRSLMDAEKLRVQITNNYQKYLGNTYESLTYEKIKLIVNELRFRLFKSMTNSYIYEDNYEDNYIEEKETRRGR